MPCVFGEVYTYRTTSDLFAIFRGCVHLRRPLSVLIATKTRYVRWLLVVVTKCVSALSVGGVCMPVIVYAKTALADC